MIPAYRSSTRSYVPELMDVEPVPYEEFAACLRDIARINAALNAYAPTLAWLRRGWAARPKDAAPFRILDAGCGYGDTLRAVAREARRRKVDVELVGIDINPWAKRVAESVTPAPDRIRFETADIFAWDDGPYDAIISSLFTHHLDDDEAPSCEELVVRHEQRGVERAFRRREWDALIARAELGGERAPRVRWEPLFRYCVAWER